MSGDQNSDGDKPGDKCRPHRKSSRKKDPKQEEIDRERAKMVAASQFAYTLVIGTCFFGFVGHWIGNKLGGAPWNLLLMFLLGAFAFAGELYRMWRLFAPTDRKASKDAGAGNPSQSDSKPDAAPPDCGQPEHDENRDAGNH